MQSRAFSEIAFGAGDNEDFRCRLQRVSGRSLLLEDSRLHGWVGRFEDFQKRRWKLEQTDILLFEGHKQWDR